MSADRGSRCASCLDIGGRGEPCEECQTVGPAGASWVRLELRSDSPAAHEPMSSAWLRYCERAVEAEAERQNPFRNGAGLAAFPRMNSPCPSSE